jgi:hypothetical protein
MTYRQYQESMLMLYGYLDYIEYNGTGFVTSMPGASFLLRISLGLVPARYQTQGK